jgi:crotonobetainyl-CoA:carnitine CoA-transferase CaiB-like acyl-CoA transferase
MVPHNIYAAAGEDDWLAIAVRNDEEWRRLVALIDEPWAADAGLLDLAGRARREDELDRSIDEWTRRHGRDELVGSLREAGILAAPVNRPNERIDDDPFLGEEWGLWPTVTHPKMGTVRVEGLPVHLSETDWTIEHPAPLLGQHNDEVFGGLLGLDGLELAELRADGVI